MKAVIWGDVIQMIILFLGIIICLFFGLNDLGGIEKFIARLQVVNFFGNSLNLDFGMLIGFFLLHHIMEQIKHNLFSKNMDCFCL